MRYSTLLGKLEATYKATIKAFDILIKRYENLIAKGATDCKINTSAQKCPMCKIYRKYHCHLCPWEMYGYRTNCGDSSKCSPVSNLRRTKAWKKRFIKEWKDIGYEQDED